MSLLPSDLDLDLSELEGRSFTCDPSCGLCCLCQPEVLPHEVSWFKSNHPRRIVETKRPHRHIALTLKEGQGACTFLNASRRCEIYAQRPHYCRQFPFHLYLGKRVQVELDLSCRGVWYGGAEDALVEGGRMVQDNVDALRETLTETRAVYRDFEANCRDAGIYRPEEALRREVGRRIEMFTELPYLAHVLDLSAEDEEMSMPDAPAGTLDAAELQRSVMEMGLESLAAEDVFSAPVYCDPKWRWNLFLVKGGSMRWAFLNDDGSLDAAGDIDPTKVKLLSPEGEGRSIFLSYLRMLNRRDSMMGYAAYLVDDYGYEDFLGNTYYGVMATTALDLLWRASLIAYLQGGRLDRAGMIEGIISYDMDRLDAPTIGAFL
jgi:Fe-S-cluster containining protein